MNVIASTEVFGMLNQLTSTLPLVYTAAQGTLHSLGYPTMGLIIHVTYASSSEAVTEAQLLTARPTAVKVWNIT